MQQPILETQDLTKRFGGLTAVDQVNFRIDQPGLVSIIGPNGAGKTTLFNLISGVLKPTSGRVRLRGSDITSLPPNRRAHLGIGRSFQITNIFPFLTVFENVRLAAQSQGNDNLKLFSHYQRFEEYKAKAADVLKQVGMEDKMQQPAISLPHGDKRKLEVAIVMARDPQVILLDEPTAGISAEEIPGIMDLIRSLQKAENRTLLLVEHRMDVVTAISDRIIVLAKGQILADGSPQDVMADEAVQASYLGGGL